jgi:hypothetical protein
MGIVSIFEYLNRKKDRAKYRVIIFYYVKSELFY